MNRIYIAVMIILILGELFPSAVLAQSDYDDEFSSPVLDDKWLWIDPNDDCSWSLTDVPGHFTFTVPHGNDLFWYENYDAPRLVQRIRGNFTAETRIKVVPGSHAFKGGGLLVWDNPKNWIFISRDNSYYQQQVQITGNLNSEISQYAVHMEDYTPHDVCLKVHRYAYDFTFSYSRDGISWEAFPPVRLKTSDSLLVGIVAFFTDYDSIGGTTTAQLDYFRVVEGGFGPCILIDGFSLDDSHGNKDGHADAGETLGIDLRVSNWGTPANDIQAQLFSEDPLVNISVGLTSLCDVGWNERTTTSFLATIDPSCVADTISFETTFFTSEFSNGDSFKVHLQQPDLTLVNWTVDDSEGNHDGRTDAGETVGYVVTISNQGDVTAKGVACHLNCQHSGITVHQHSAFFGDIAAGENSANSAEPFVVEADTGMHVQDVVLTMNLQSGEYYEKTIQCTVRVGRADILLLNDCWTPQHNQYTVSLDSVGLLYESWDMQADGLPSFDLRTYSTLIWFTGEERDSTITPAEQALVAEYLDAGGHLIMSGQNIGYDLVENGSEDDALFYAAYLHAEYIDDGIAETFLRGVEGDPITGEFALFTLDANQASASVIAPGQGASPILTYYSSGGTAAIKYEGDHTMVYFAFGCEGIQATSGNDDQIRGALIDNIIRWFNYVPSVGDVNQDGRMNIMDVLMAVNIVLGVVEPTSSQTWAADCNDDGLINIMDVIGIVNVVLGIGTCPPAGETKMTSTVRDYLESLESFMFPQDFTRLMAQVKAEYIPAEYRLSQNYPNPFNPITSIDFCLPRTSRVRLSVFNILGQEIDIVIDDQLEAGYHTVAWNASEVTSGMYFYKLAADDCAFIRRMVLMK